MLDTGLAVHGGGRAHPLDRDVPDRTDRAVPAAPEAPEPGSGFLDIPCSMLLRDLAALCGDGWAPSGTGHVLTAPKGSRVLAPGPASAGVVDTLRSAGPKVLQVFALALDLWAADTGGRDPGVPAVRRLGDLSRALAGGAHTGRDREAIRSLLEALAGVEWEAAPGVRLPGGDPGPPIRLHAAAGAGAGSVAFSPGPAWVRGLTGAGHRVAKLPRSFLGLHARNDRYRILLTWYLAIMLRVNRKHGFRYRVGMRMLLEGAGIDIPDRNVSRFLAAIYRALEDLPGIRVRAPRLTMYDPAAVLGAMVDFSLDPLLLPEYAS